MYVRVFDAMYHYVLERNVANHRSVDNAFLGFDQYMSQSRPTDG